MTRGDIGFTGFRRAIMRVLRRRQCQLHRSARDEHRGVEAVLKCGAAQERDPRAPVHRRSRDRCLWPMPPRRARRRQRADHHQSRRAKSWRRRHRDPARAVDACRRDIDSDWQPPMPNVLVAGVNAGERTLWEVPGRFGLRRISGWSRRLTPGHYAFVGRATGDGRAGRRR